MKDLISTALRYQNGVLTILDQTKLPFDNVWVECRNLARIIEVIKSLKVRGAPLIGIAASVFIGYLAVNDASKDEVISAIKALKASRPTAVNLANNLNQILKALDYTNYKSKIIDTVEALFDEDVKLCQNMANYGSQIIMSYNNILTHCNTGSLATVGIGTALGVIKNAYEVNEKIHVFVDETRPLLQGARLTAWELQMLGIPHTLICDSMAASLMQQGMIDAVIVGADRIARNGDFANKIGTYALAVLAQYHQIPFYVVAPKTTIDFQIDTGTEILIEMRHTDEIKGFSHHKESMQWAPKDTQAYNPAFDVTPNHLVSGWILDSGVFNKDSFASTIEHGLTYEI